MTQPDAEVKRLLMARWLRRRREAGRWLRCKGTPVPRARSHAHHRLHAGRAELPLELNPIARLFYRLSQLGILLDSTNPASRKTGASQVFLGKTPACLQLVFYNRVFLKVPFFLWSYHSLTFKSWSALFTSALISSLLPDSLGDAGLHFSGADAIF